MIYKQIVAKCFLLFAFVTMPIFAFAQQGNVAFLKIAAEERVDPYLLYAVLIVESGMDLNGDRVIAPHPFTIRYGNGVVKRLSSAHDLRTEGERASGEFPHWTIDVGWGQINRKWQARYFEKNSPLDPYDPADNIRIAARVLRDAIASTDDKILGLGRYNTWADEGTARWYGTRVDYLARILRDRAKKDLAGI
jgi:hypothetical protein